MAEDHPSPFSKKVLVELEKIVIKERERLGYEPWIIDPFAGIGRVHTLGSQTWGVEIEPEWAERHERTLTGDSRRLRDYFPGSFLFDMCVVSPTYGNRMADHHDARERCKACKGQWPGKIEVPSGTRGDTKLVDCPKCGGTGHRVYKRNTYKHRLGRDLTEGNSGAMQWGDEYRDLHRQVWDQVAQIVKPGGLFVLNISDHIRKKKVVAVSSWHMETILRDPLWTLERDIAVNTPRNRFGANREARVANEWIFTFRRSQ